MKWNIPCISSYLSLRSAVCLLCCITSVLEEKIQGLKVWRARCKCYLFVQSIYSWWFRLRKFIALKRHEVLSVGGTFNIHLHSIGSSSSITLSLIILKNQFVNVETICSPLVHFQTFTYWGYWVSRIQWQFTSHYVNVDSLEID